MRRLLQALDPDLLTTAISGWLAGTRAAAPSGRRAIAVDGKTIRGSRSVDTAARHVMAALDQSTGVVLASTDVAGKTNEITRMPPLLDQIGDLRETVITLDSLHCQRGHVAYLAERGAHWILTVKANQPGMHAQLTALPWQAVPRATRDADRGHGRREIWGVITARRTQVIDPLEQPKVRKLDRHPALRATVVAGLGAGRRIRSRAGWPINPSRWAMLDGCGTRLSTPGCTRCPAVRLEVPPRRGTGDLTRPPASTPRPPASLVQNSSASALAPTHISGRSVATEVLQRYNL